MLYMKRSLFLNVVSDTACWTVILPCLAMLEEHHAALMWQRFTVGFVRSSWFDLMCLVSFLTLQVMHHPLSHHLGS